MIGLFQAVNITITKLINTLCTVQAIRPVLSKFRSAGYADMVPLTVANQHNVCLYFHHHLQMCQTSVVTFSQIEGYISERAIVTENGERYVIMRGI